MKKDNTKQEILFMTTSSFAQRKLCEKDFPEDPPGKTASHEEKMEEACWNGLLGEWLKGTIVNAGKGEKLFLWKIHAANKFLCIELAQTPAPVDQFYSLDPYLFLQVRNNN